jgi:hypothetical protein
MELLSGLFEKIRRVKDNSVLGRDFDEGTL